jgi:hypothetical protein
MKLQRILELADAVKFAKYQALQNENDLSIRYSVEFVESTKEIIEENSDIKQTEAKIEINEESEKIKSQENE